MQTLDSDRAFLSLEISSIATGYQALRHLSEDESLRVLDASPAGRGFFILASGEKQRLEAALQKVRAVIEGAEAWIDRELLAPCEPSVIDALFALPQTPVDQSLVVIECDTVSACLASANTLTHGHGLKAIEIRIKRSTGGAYGFFTGDAKNAAVAAEDIRTKLRTSMREGRVELIEGMSTTFRSYFNLEG